jgi:TRAP-type C4-dicarboxylate transport system substrate-binding protein
MAKIATAIVMSVVVASLVAFTPRVADTQQRSPAKITWDLVQTLGLDHPITLKHKEFAQMVYERTNGRMEIIVRGPGELPYRGSEALRIVGRGQVAAAEAITVFVQAEAPLMGITELPFLIRNWDEAWKVRKLVDKHYAAAFDRFGVVPIVYCIYGPTNTWTKVPIKSMDETKGMKIRATTAEIGDITKAYGGIPITLLTVDTYQALKTGVADGFIGNTVTSFGQKWYEATPYVLRNAVGFVSQQIVVNKKALEGLPEDIRSIVLKAARETEVNLEAMLRKADRGLEQKLVEQGSLKGITIPTPEEKAKNRAMASTVWRAWANRNGPDAVQALETLLKDMDR